MASFGISVALLTAGAALALGGQWVAAELAGLGLLVIGDIALAAALVGRPRRRS